MKISLYPLFFSLLCTFNVSAQSVCEISLNSNSPEMAQCDDAPFNCNEYQIRLYFHIIRSSNGTGGVNYNDVINSVIPTVKSHFSNTNVVVYIQGVGYINNDVYFNNANSITGNKFYDLVSDMNYKQPNCINVYLGPSGGLTGDGRGDIMQAAAVLTGSRIEDGLLVDISTSKIVSHEIGHVLGLHHTDRGTASSGPGLCRELVNGSNCATCGDLVCDTPADNGLSGKPLTNCIWINPLGPTDLDTNNDPYNPDARNIMSLSYSKCYEHFTRGQGARMRQYLSCSPYLQNVIKRIRYCAFFEPESARLSSTVIAFPNPIEDYVNIATRLHLEKVRITVFSDLGIKMGNPIFIENLFPNQVYAIDLTNLHSGIYTLKIESKNMNQVIRISKN